MVTNRQCSHRRGNGHEQAIGSQEGGLVTNRQWGQRRGMVMNRQWGHRRWEWSRTGSRVTREGMVTNSGVIGGGNGHEQTVGSQEEEWSRTGRGVTGGGNSVAVLLVTADNGVTGREMVTNRQCGHRRGNGHEQAVGSQEGEMVTNRQWGHRRGKWSRTGGGVTGRGMVTNSGVTRGGNSHEQAVGSQEGGIQWRSC